MDGESVRVDRKQTDTDLKSGLTDQKKIGADRKLSGSDLKNFRADQKTRPTRLPRLFV